MGGDAEKVIGKSAPWFVLAVMLFSYAVRALYIESSAMFVRGGVYRVVKNAHGRDSGQTVGFGPAVRLHPHRSDQRRCSRPIYRRVHHRHAPSPRIHNIHVPDNLLLRVLRRRW